MGMSGGAWIVLGAAQIHAKEMIKNKEVK